jgi:hypothetical protein
MSDSQIDQTSFEERLGLFVEAWKRHFIASITSLFGGQVELLEDSEPASASPDCWFHIAFPPWTGSLSLGLDREAVLAIGGEGESDVGDPTAESSGREGVFESFVRMLSQAAGAMSVELSGLSGCEVRTAAVTPSDQPPPCSKHVVQLRLA